MNEMNLELELAEEILERTNYDLENFSLSDKIVFKEICEKQKEFLVKYIEESLPTIEFFCDMDIAEEMNKSKVPDFQKIRNLSVGYRYDIDKCMELHRQSVRNNIEKMGGI